MKKLTFAAISLLIISGKSSGMQPIAAKTIGQLGKHYGKKGFSGTMTALHWTIAAGGSIIQGLQKIKELSDEEKTLAEYTHADEKVTNFIASELETVHNIKIDSVRISPQNPHDPNPFPTIASFANHILINSTTANEIIQDEKSHNKWRAVSGHEAVHNKKQDVHWRIFADLILPFVTHGSVKMIRNALPLAKKTRSFLGEQFIKIPTAFGKDSITALCRMSFYKYQEQRADNGVPNEIEKLIGMKEYLKDADHYRLNELKKKFNVSDEAAKKIDRARNILEPHPLPRKRIAKLDQRIASLEKQSLEKNNRNDLYKSLINLDESLIVI